MVESYVGKERFRAAVRRKRARMEEWTQECRVEAFRTVGFWMAGKRTTPLEAAVAKRVMTTLWRLNAAVYGEIETFIPLDDMMFFTADDVLGIDKFVSNHILGLPASIAARPDDCNRYMVDRIGQIQVDAFASLTPGGKHTVHRVIGGDIDTEHDAHPYHRIVDLQRTMSRDRIALTRERIARIVTVRIIEIERERKRKRGREEAPTDSTTTPTAAERKPPKGLRIIVQNGVKVA